MKYETVVSRFKKLLDDTRFEDDTEILCEVLNLAFKDKLFVENKEE